ncbi:RNA 3'-terminal phosphate cyclase [Parvularcula dongshanensis]|uniref:RNA 3'-terminal phosphate cyclase n=1 Tax=Parvularcula dongshanensis TaxID=1173995 RepID=A0A840I8J8_9PROT|nr:RNA 3'-terminal phosphate cyclase [Parvularcula dongshanensis]MBB4660280.1 RNA 3'-terminal phosphate cyclase (ATP) [Parvularcula dongshanensis]
MITIDGSEGEGGGQVLRSALSLSACTGQAFRIKNIRSGRKKPGLMRQHLTCVHAAAAVCGGKAVGGQLGSTELAFTPGEPRGGEFAFDVGTAGATTLVFQTLLPILLAADEPSTLRLCGGTHTMSAPTLDFVTHAFLPPLRAVGARVDTSLVRRGFYPAAGGEWTATIAPLDAPAPLDLCERGAIVSVTAEALRANLRSDICEREIAVLRDALALSEDAVRHVTCDGPGPGNVVQVYAEHEAHTEVFSELGRYGVKAETVARRAADEARAYLSGDGTVSEHLADQLLLPLALLAGGRFTATVLSSHFHTNVRTIGTFLDVDVEFGAHAQSQMVQVGKGVV